MRKVSLAAILVMLMALTLFADVPNEITYTGKLKEYGQSVTGSRSINFRIYAAETGPGQVWESGAHSVTVASGTFSTVLSPGIDLRNKDFWIETIVSGKTLAPREKITAQFYALHAGSAENVRVPSGRTINFVIGNSTCAALSPAGELKTTVSGVDYFMVPRGGIIMWSGSIVNIPNGWVLCDGTNSTPDLTNRFVVGAGSSYAVNIAGGVSVHTHTVNTFTSNGLDINNNASNNTGQPSNTAHADGNGGGGILTTWDHTHDYSHHHSINAVSSSTSNLPPYYALAFIMKQ